MLAFRFWLFKNLSTAVDVFSNFLWLHFAVFSVYTCVVHVVFGFDRKAVVKYLGVLIICRISLSDQDRLWQDQFA